MRSKRVRSLNTAFFPIPLSGFVRFARFVVNHHPCFALANSTTNPSVMRGPRIARIARMECEVSVRGMRLAPVCLRRMRSKRVRSLNTASLPVPLFGFVRFARFVVTPYPCFALANSTTNPSVMRGPRIARIARMECEGSVRGRRLAPVCLRRRRSKRVRSLNTASLPVPLSGFVRFARFVVNHHPW
jgi:hypothetical protein